MGFFNNLFKNPVHALIEDANNHKFSKQYDKAIACYDELIRQDPGCAWMYFGDRTLCRKEKGDFAGAIPDFTQLVQHEPTNRLHYYNRGECLLNTGEFDKAVADLGQSINLEAADIAAGRGFSKTISTYPYRLRGLAYFGKGDFAKAAADFSEVFRICPLTSATPAPVDWSKPVSQATLDHITTMNLRGLAYSCNDEYDKAVADFTETLRYLPQFSVYYFNRACTYLKMGQTQMALADLNEAIRLMPADAPHGPVYQTRAMVHRSLGDEASAAADERKAQDVQKAATPTSTASSSCGPDMQAVGKFVLGAAGLAGAGFLAVAALKILVVGSLVVAAGAAAASVMSKCRHCGSPLNEGYNVCPQCGQTSQW